MSEVNITIPERGSESPAPAPAAATPDTEAAKSVTPEALKADGKSAEQDPAPKAPDDKEPTPGEMARKERNRQRWQQMKTERTTAMAEVNRLRAEVARLKQPADFSNITDPDEALALRTAAKVRESMAGDQESQLGQQQHRADQALYQAWDAMKDEMRSKAPDFDQVVTAQTPIHQRMAPFLIESEKGGEVAYWLGKNTDAAQALFREFETNPAAALIQFGRIEAQLSAPSAKPISNAPRPAPVLAGGSSPPAFDPATASVSDIAGQLRKAGIIR